MAKSNSKKNFNIERTPVVAVMGHVDHGKTTLLDTIRGTNVVGGEAGGITQNTRAHQIVFQDQKITFIDTPGHEAFTDMRSRGAKVTDIVLLVVAADDGVQPQTKESIKFALEQKVPVIVAINKTDLPGKNLGKLKQELSSAGLQLEEYGGEVIVNEVSALKNTGIDGLLESILLVSELSELKQDKPKDGIAGTAFVLESYLDKTLGSVSLVLVKSGEFTKDDYVVYEGGYSKIRALLNENSEHLEEVEQGDPIRIIGIKDTLSTGEYINIVKQEKEAKALFREIEKGEATLLEEQEDEVAVEENDLDLLASLFSEAKTEEEVKYLNVVIKTGSRGTLEVVTKELQDLNDEEVQIKIIDSGVGQITEKDIMTAKAAHGIIIGFQVEVQPKLVKQALKEKVLIRTYEIIYDIVEEMADVLDSMADPVHEKVEVARAKVKQVFVLSNKKIVAGSEVVKGTVLRGYRAYVERDGAEMADGKIVALKHLKQEVKEVKKGHECGILLEPDYDDLQEGDDIVCYKLEQI